MDLPNAPDRTWQTIRQDVLLNNSIQWVQQGNVPPIPPDLDAHTDVLPGIRVHHRSWAGDNDIAVWEPATTNVYIVTRYGRVRQLIDSKENIPQSVISILILAGGAVVAKILWDLLQNQSGGSGSAPSGPKGATEQRPRPGTRQYNVFISHAWDYNDDYERVVDFLDDYEDLEWQNHSVPLNDPLDTVNDAHLRSRLQDKIRTTAIVLVLAGMYSAHREWIETEIEIANEFEKPIVGIRPHGSEQTPNIVEDAAVEMVGWQQKSIVGAAVEHSISPN